MNAEKNLLGLIARCKDEYFVTEFCEYYISQGVDHIYIIDDNSLDKHIYDNISLDQRITIIYELDIITNNYAQVLYEQVRGLFQWLIYVDVDEFIRTYSRKNISIRSLLIGKFADVDCIKIPWVMMSCNAIIKSPAKVLENNIFRWNHDKKHPHNVHKFRCRYSQIEVKCIFKPAKFDRIWDHHPICNGIEMPIVVESINGKPSALDPFYDNLREMDIKKGYLLCYHYRIISVENCIEKLKNNYWYKKDKYMLDDLISSDYPEIIDRTMISEKKFERYCLIHIGKCGGSYLEANLNIPRIHMQKPVFEEETGYIIWVRNPIKRFVSAFNHSLALISYEVGKKDFETLYHDKDSPYYKLANKIKNKLSTGHPFAEWNTGIEYEELIKYFQTPNRLAEALSSSDSEMKRKAAKLVTNEEVEHIAKGIGWYLDSGEFIKEHHRNILFVGRTEQIQNDLKRLNRKLNLWNEVDAQPVRQQTMNLDSNLSPLAVRNIIDYYSSTDYAALKTLVQYGFISEDTYNEYYSFP